MNIFDKINSYLFHHPQMLDQLEFAFRLKFWLLLGLFAYFILLVALSNRQQTQRKTSIKDGKFLA